MTTVTESTVCGIGGEEVILDSGIIELNIHLNLNHM